MAQLWGGRFTKETDKLVYNFNASISFDKKFYKQDMRGSMAHVKMLAKQGILTEEERDAILAGIEGILADVESGKLKITDEYEDIHSFVEAVLIDRIGDPGKKLHTGRSRNDQVALHKRRDYSHRRPGGGSAGSSSAPDERQYGDFHAGLHPSSEGPAHHAGPSSGRLF